MQTIMRKSTHCRREILRRRIRIYTIFCSDEAPTQLLKDVEDDSTLLQDHICDNLRPEFNYATGESILNAIIEIPISSILNGTEKL